MKTVINNRYTVHTVRVLYGKNIDGSLLDFISIINKKNRIKGRIQSGGFLCILTVAQKMSYGSELWYGSCFYVVY